MRTGGYTLQHSLTPEAATIIKHAVSLARRRGHTHVTPLHVASAMLSSSTGLLKRACLHSHSHPLQCKALELCFNVALNRLPTSAGTPLLAPHPQLPSLSNALIAAFKRAQAHQRRGSIENQQQSILALKVENEQLVISILDDPSVSRVMREAGFSSTQVKSNVEKTVSLENCSSQSQPKELDVKPLVLGNTGQFRLSFSKTVNPHYMQNDDVMSVLESMMNKNTKNCIIVSDSPTAAENVIRGVIDKFDKRDVSVEMRFVQFISVPLFTLRNISKEEFEVKLGELRSLVKSHMSGGVVLYLGDLQWVSEFWSKYGEKNSSVYNSPMEYMIMEISRLVCGKREINTKLWLMGTASFQTYARCKTGSPSLETLWSFHPLRIPVGTSLALSLSLDHCGLHGYKKMEAVDDINGLYEETGIDKQLVCCSDCSVNFKREAQAVMNDSQTSTSSLPSWLRQYEAVNIPKQNNFDQVCDRIKNICKKWNSICSSVHAKKPHFLENMFSLATPSPSSSTSISSKSNNIHQSLINWPVIFNASPSANEHQLLLFENDSEVSKPTIPDLLSNPNSSPNSASSSEASGDLHALHKFEEFNQENLNILSIALQEKVSWQTDVIPEIATTILKCKSGIMRKDENRTESWLLFLGADSEGKETIAKELAKTVFGSYDNFTSITPSRFSSSTKSDTCGDEVSNKKRIRDEHGGSPYERFLEAVIDNPRRLFFIEDVDQFDIHCLKGFERVIQNGSFTLPEGDVVMMKDAIVIFSCENVAKTADEEGEEKSDAEKTSCLLDLNIATDDQDASDQIGIFGLVDKQIVFKIQVL